MWYALIVAALSLAGAAVPLRAKPGHAQLQIYLSLAAGALLGAALFHLIPEAAELAHGKFSIPLALGVVVVFLMQRYPAPHSHEISPHDATHGHDHAAHEHEHDHVGAGPHGPVHTECGHVHIPQEHGAAGPFLTGMVAVFALSIHSLIDGIALGAAAWEREEGGEALALSVFLSVLIHKPLDGLSVSVLLMQARVSRKTLWAVQIFYAALVPIGAYGFSFFGATLEDATTLVGYTLAFSGGTFLAIALTDLLPELHFHTHDRHKLSAALILGLAVMWVTSLIGHGDHAHGPKPAHTEVDEHAGHDH